METGDIAQEVVEARAGDPACCVHVHTVKALHDLGVVGNFKVGHQGLTKALDLHIVLIVGANGDRGINYVGDHQHNLANFLGQLVLALFQGGQALGVGHHLGLDGLGLLELGGVLLGLAH